MGCSNHNINVQQNPDILKTLTVPLYTNNKDNNNIYIDDYRMRAILKHNYYRSLHNSPELQINKNLNEIAQEYAKKLIDKNNYKDYDINIYNDTFLGQNVIISTKMTPEDMCLKWYNEGAEYDYKLNKYQNNKGHFTQIIWKNTKEVGFGFHLNDSGIFCGVAVYFPAGNILGEYANNIQAPHNDF